MSAQKMADLVSQGKFRDPYWFTGIRDPFADRLLRTTLTIAMGTLQQRPAILATNVMRYVEEQSNEHRTSDYPGARPVFDSMWIEGDAESRGTTHRQRIGFLVAAADREAFKDQNLPPAYSGLYDLARREGQWPDNCRWMLDVAMFALAPEGDSVVGPLRYWNICLDENGNYIQETYGKYTSLGTGMQHEQDEDGYYPRDPDDPAYYAIFYVLQTLQFLNVRNVVVEKCAPAKKVSDKYQKKTGKPLQKWQTISIQPLGTKTVRASGVYQGGTNLVGQHIAKGHLAHYGDCCPGAHEPNGKLFGKLEGVYWVPMHVRGNPSVGQIHTNIEVDV